MMAKHARRAARLAQQGPRTIEDVLGSDDFCLMRIAGTSTFACFDCEMIVYGDAEPVSERVRLIEMTNDQAAKAAEVLEHSGKWDCVHQLDGTMEELLREVDDYDAMETLQPTLTPEQRQALRDMIEAAYRDADAAEKAESMSPAEMAKLFEKVLPAQKRRFREKFGREMGTGTGEDDPVFFDENAETPQPISEESQTQMLVEAKGARGAGAGEAELGRVNFKEGSHGVPEGSQSSQSRQKSRKATGSRCRYRG
jgi:hypothetical protein